MASTGEAATWRLGHRPALDGLRGMAVLLVVACHTWPEAIHTGIHGVLMFFVLSGFLITALLLEEHHDRGRIDLGAFYKRRALRLLPALLGFLAIIALLGAATGAQFLSWRQAWPVLLYVENFAVILTGHTGIVLHLWSLAVEEQFYIVWPIVLLALIRWPRLLVLFVAVGIGASVAMNWVAVGGSDYHLAYGFDTNAGALLLGCGLAIFMHRREEVSSRVGFATIAACVVVAIGVLPGPWTGLSARALVPLLTATAIYCIANGRTSSWWMSRALVLVGRRSYALYIWHTPLAFGLLLGPMRAAGVSDWVAVPVYLAAAWLITTASWHLIERPFLALKDRAQPHPATVARAAA